MKPSDLFLVVVAGYVIYKMGFVDGMTPVNLFILVCLIIAVITTILTRTGTLGRWEKKKQDAEKELLEKEKNQKEESSKTPDSMKDDADQEEKKTTPEEKNKGDKEE